MRYYNDLEKKRQNIYNPTQQQQARQTQQQSQPMAQTVQQNQQNSTNKQPETNWAAEYDKVMGGNPSVSMPAQYNARAQGGAVPMNASPAAQQSLGAGAGQWQAELDNIMNQIMNREKFSYDMNGDAMYQQYADMFQNQANLGMMNAMGQAAAMTGGYGSSYGQMVGQQAFAQQMQGLNEVGMDLYGQALNQYMMEGDQLAQQYAMLAEREAQAYNRGLDQRNFEYQQMLDDRAQSNYEREFGYQQQRDTIADSQWDQTLQYQKDRDLVADSQWQAQMDYQTGRDSVADTQWQQQFESSEAQRAADNAYRDSMMQYQQIRDQVSDEQWRAELDRMLANDSQHQGLFK